MCEQLGERVESRLCEVKSAMDDSPRRLQFNHNNTDILLQEVRKQLKSLEETTSMLGSKCNGAAEIAETASEDVQTLQSRIVVLSDLFERLEAQVTSKLKRTVKK